MSGLVPIDKQTGRKRPVDEHERGRLRKEQDKAEWNRRNNRKWKHD